MCREYAKAKKKRGDHRLGSGGPPSLARGSLFNSPQRNVVASLGEVAMFFAICNFTAVRWAALFAARVAVGAAVRSGDGVIWGVSDPLCHPPMSVPGPTRGSLTPQMHVFIVRRNRAQSVTLRSAAPVSYSAPASTSSVRTRLVRFSPETAFVLVSAQPL
jgi:hypothetical protein